MLCENSDDFYYLENLINRLNMNDTDSRALKSARAEVL